MHRLQPTGRQKPHARGRAPVHRSVVRSGRSGLAPAFPEQNVTLHALCCCACGSRTRWSHVGQIASVHQRALFYLGLFAYVLPWCMCSEPSIYCLCVINVASCDSSSLFCPSCLPVVASRHASIGACQDLEIEVGFCFCTCIRISGSTGHCFSVRPHIL